MALVDRLYLHAEKIKKLDGDLDSTESLYAEALAIARDLLPYCDPVDIEMMDKTMHADAMRWSALEFPN